MKITVLGAGAWGAAGGVTDGAVGGARKVVVGGWVAVSGGPAAVVSGGPVAGGAERAMSARTSSGTTSRGVSICQIRMVGLP